ncbi:MAG TPA: helix-turn-helix domain-containing protein [Syntrophales bacterium]|nr:helix-turn-helix domain-containing protein [Syntrophales bacterium]
MSELPNKALLRPDEAAEYYGVARATIYKWVFEGKIEAVKLGEKTIRIPREAILAFPRAVNE